jgi:hypothetical protein
MNSVSRFSIYRKMSLEPKMRAEALSISPFLGELQEFIHIEDVAYEVPDPPDFTIKLYNGTIGVELTKSNPKPSGKGGYQKIGEFQKWKKDIETKPLPRHEFEWGEYSLRESLAAFQSEVERKSQRAKTYASRFDEIWLVLQAESGSPHGSLTEGSHNAKSGFEEKYFNFVGKHLFEMCRICKSASPFHLVILFCGPKILALPARGSVYELPSPNEDLLKRGSKASDEFLDWKRELRSVTRHYDESQGDITKWLMNFR